MQTPAIRDSTSHRSRRSTLHHDEEFCFRSWDSYYLIGTDRPAGNLLAEPRARLNGNLPLALAMLVAIWVLAALGEELAYRGYVLERAATLGWRSPRAYVAAVVAVSVLFGLGHFYQGIAGMADSTLSALLLGMLYLAGGRNLWLPILAHGFSNTIGLGLVYLGIAPI